MRKAAPLGAAVERANREEGAESQANPAITREVKQYPSIAMDGSVTIGTGRRAALL
jgi:hypothetical protein